jgi:hypothetical protein
MDGTDSVSCPMTKFGISGAELLVSTTGELIDWLVGGLRPYS